MRLLGVALLAGAVVVGCAVGPNYKRPPVVLPDRFYGEQAAAEARSFGDLPWWDVFKDPVLKGLVEEALKNGYDARLAVARVQEARALYGVSRAQRLPSVDYQGGWLRVRPDQFLNPSGVTLTEWTAEVEAKWELDLWGRVRRLNESARARYLATEEARRGVLLSLLSEVATAYFELCELDADLEIAQRTTVAFRDTYNLFSRRLEGGAASALETSRAEASLGQVAAQIPEIERAIVARENQINLLLGRNPQPIERGGPSMPLPPETPAGLPSSLLQRRPDVRQAEQLLVGANADIGVAKAAFFPTLSLTGLFGNVSPELGDLFSKGKTWSVGTSALGPLFHGGAIKRNYEAVKARWEQARIEYEATVTQSPLSSGDRLGPDPARPADCRGEPVQGPGRGVAGGGRPGGPGADSLGYERRRLSLGSGSEGPEVTPGPDARALGSTPNPSRSSGSGAFFKPQGLARAMDKALCRPAAAVHSNS